MASDVAMQINAQSRVVWISPAIEEVLGWRVDEIVGTSIFDRMHPDDVARGQRARDNVMSGNVVRNDLRFLTKDGTYRWMSARLAPVVGEHGEVVGRVAGWHDVTAEYELRDQLEQREEQFRILVENANDVVLLQVEGRVVFASPAVERILGWTPDELIGREVTSLWHRNDQDAAEALHTLSLRADSSNVMRMQHRDGSVRWIEISASPSGSRRPCAASSARSSARPCSRRSPRYLSVSTRTSPSRRWTGLSSSMPSRLSQESTVTRCVADWRGCGTTPPRPALPVLRARRDHRRAGAPPA